MQGQQLPEESAELGLAGGSLNLEAAGQVAISTPLVEGPSRNSSWDTVPVTGPEWARGGAAGRGGHTRTLLLLPHGRTGVTRAV